MYYVCDKSESQGTLLSQAMMIILYNQVMIKFSFWDRRLLLKSERQTFEEAPLKNHFIIKHNALMDSYKRSHFDGVTFTRICNRNNIAHTETKLSFTYIIFLTTSIFSVWLDPNSKVNSGK